MREKTKRTRQCQSKYKGSYNAIFPILLCASCTNPSVLNELLFGALPEGAKASISETCMPLLQGAVAFLDEVTLPDTTPLEASNATGEWVRSLSLASFAEADKIQYRGAGVSATILDGKDCIRELSSDAEQILFEQTSGWYFRSNDREVVIVVFDEPPGKGVMFVQAP